MKLSSKAAYGILASVDLALHNGHAPVSARAIAQRQRIPARFLEHVLYELKRAGVIESHRGAQGGYVLSRNPGDISLAEIVEALEGPIDAAGKSLAGPRPRGHRDSVVSHVVGQLQEAELAVLRAVTVGSLAERQQALEQERALMYHI